MNRSFPTDFRFPGRSCIDSSPPAVTAPLCRARLHQLHRPPPVSFGLHRLLLAAGALGYVLGLGRSAALDAELTRQIDGRIDALREEQRRAIETQWRADGVSPIERTWQELSQASAADGDSAAAFPPSEAVDRRMQEMIRERCEQVWRGIGEKRYWRQVDGRTVGPDLGAIGEELESIVREVAALYHQDKKNPVMEAHLGDIVLTSRSILGELLQVASQVPVIDLPRQSLETGQDQNRAGRESARCLPVVFAAQGPVRLHMRDAGVACPVRSAGQAIPSRRLPPAPSRCPCRDTAGDAPTMRSDAAAGARSRARPVPRRRVRPGGPSDPPGSPRRVRQ